MDIIPSEDGTHRTCGVGTLCQIINQVYYRDRYELVITVRGLSRFTPEDHSSDVEFGLGVPRLGVVVRLCASRPLHPPPFPAGLCV